MKFPDWVGPAWVFVVLFAPKRIVFASFALVVVLACIGNR